MSCISKFRLYKNYHYCDWKFKQKELQDLVNLIMCPCSQRWHLSLCLRLSAVWIKLFSLICGERLSANEYENINLINNTPLRYLSKFSHTQNISSFQVHTKNWAVVGFLTRCPIKLVAFECEQIQSRGRTSRLLWKKRQFLYSIPRPQGLNSLWKHYFCIR